MRAFYFDCLRRDEVTLADLPARERFAALSEVVPAAQLIPRLVTRSSESRGAFYDEALAQGHEGLMAKSLDAPYEAGNRGRELAQDQTRAHARPGGARVRNGATAAARENCPTCISVHSTLPRSST